MYIVYNPGRYISAILNDESTARKYWEKCPAGQMFLAFPYIKSYPFFIVEAQPGSFRFFATKADLDAETFRRPYVVYEIVKDFAPTPRGKDQMGVLGQHYMIK
jgi:hypothetical protein